MTPAAVDRPMFVAARLAAAARAAEPSVRVTLLRAAVAADPAGAGVRVPLFRAELAAGKAADAIESAAADPAPQPFAGEQWSDGGRTRAPCDGAGKGVPPGRDWLPEAVRFFTIALEGQNAAARAPIRQQITALNDEIGRRTRNAVRQPQVREAIDQLWLVRPRIPPRDAPQGGAR